MFKTLSAGLLVALVTGCATNKTPVVYETIRETPPAHLLLECPDPVVQYETNGDLAQAILAWADALRKCNIDKQALRDWAKE